jgi:predicted ATPase
MRNRNKLGIFWRPAFVIQELTEAHVKQRFAFSRRMLAELAAKGVQFIVSSDES